MSLERKEYGKLTPEITAELCSFLRLGLPYERAAQLVGVTRATFHKWRSMGRKAKSGKYRDFWQAIETANAQAEAVHARNIAQAAAEPRTIKTKKTVTKADGSVEVHEIEKDAVADWRASQYILMARFGDRWRVNPDVELSVKSDEPIPLTIIKGMDPDEV